MKLNWIGSAVVYIALAVSANFAAADNAQYEALREGSMKKLVFHSVPKPTPTSFAAMLLF